MTTATKKRTESKKRKSAKTQAKKSIVKIYDYLDEAGCLLYQMVRLSDKSFAYRRPNPENPPNLERRPDLNDPDARKHWLWGIGGDKRLVLYHLPQWINASKQVWQFIVEGEKDVETLEGLGFAATTNPMGAGKWKPDYNERCEGRLVMIICDRDEQGERHGLQIATSLNGITGQTKIAFIEPDLPKGSDVTDLVEKHNWTAKNFIDLIEKTSTFIPKEISSQVVTKKLSEVEPVPVQWLWFNRFAQGKLCLLVGNPGVGKSFASLDMAARISTGDYWPDGYALPDGAGRAPRGSVLILTAEDGLADTVRPRLDKMQADCSKIHAIEGVHLAKDDTQHKFWPNGELPVTDFFNLSRDIELLKKKLEQIEDVKLIIIDPLSAYYGAKLDTHRDAAIRSVLAPLAEVAERHNVCIIAISHLRKSPTETAIFRVTGSIGQTAAARMAWAILLDRENHERRCLMCLKNNLSREKLGLAFQITDGRVEYEQNAITDSIDDMLRDESEQGASVQEAIEFIDDIFVEDLNPKASDIIEKARKKGISRRTLMRTKAALGIISKHHPSGFWRWEKPEPKNTDKDDKIGLL